MITKKVSFLTIVSIVVIIAVLASTFVFMRPVSVSAAEYVRFDKETRVKFAQERYCEFSSNPEKKYEVLVSFKNVPYKEISSLMAGEDNIISAFHCFEANGECAVGGYTECEGKNAERVVEDYYASIYNLISGQIESYDGFVAGLRKSFGFDDGFAEEKQAYDLPDTFGKEIDTSPIIIEDSQKEPDMTIEEALQDASHSLAQFVLQKEAMDNGDFYIYGMRLVMTGSEIEKLLSNDIVTLVEILDFDNNSIITPIK